MNRIITICAAVLMTASVFAQSPEKMSYQAVVRDGSDALVATKTVGMQISILQGTSTGTAVYTETQTQTTNANGLVSLEIGIGTTSDDFSTIDWSDGPYFIKTETDPSGGANYTITGTSELLSVPYALYAKSAASVNETDPAYTQSEAANITATDITNLGNLSGTNTGDQDLSTYATKAYLDNQGYLKQVPSVTRSIIITPGMIDLDYTVSSGVSKVRFGGWTKPALSLTNDFNRFDFNFPMPSDWNGEQITLKVLFSTSDTGKEVVIDITNSGVSLGENSGDVLGGVNSEAVPGSTTTNELMEYTRGLFTQPTDRMVQVSFGRKGSDSRDTSTGNMLVFGFTIEYNTK